MIGGKDATYSLYLLEMGRSDVIGDSECTLGFSSNFTGTIYCAEFYPQIGFGALDISFKFEGETQSRFAICATL